MEQFLIYRPGQVFPELTSIPPSSLQEASSSFDNLAADMYQDMLSGLSRFYTVESIDGEALFGIRLPLALAYGLLCTASFFGSGIVLGKVSATYRRLPKQARTDWDNRMVALGHAVIMSYRAFRYWIVLKPLFGHTFSLLSIAPALDMYEKDTMRIMIGYMLYDLVVELATPAVYDYAVLFHHLAGILSHWHTLQTNDVASGWYTMLVYLAEGSTPILHTAWMMNTVGLSDGVAFKLLTLALLVTFFVVRILVSPLLAYTYLAPGNRHLYDGRDGVFYFQLFIVFAFAGLNYFWFYKLLTLIYRKARGIKTPISSPVKKRSKPATEGSKSKKA